jgi:hypothetical protein
MQKEGRKKKTDMLQGMLDLLISYDRCGMAH